MNIKEMTKLTGLTAKTLRHWEAKGLLTAGRAENDYRTYSAADLTRIFYIMSLRRLDLPIAGIRAILSSDVTEAVALAEHLTRLEQERSRLSSLIDHLTEKQEKGDFTMNEEDFELLKDQQLKENDAQYGAEVVSRWGAEAYAKSNAKYKAMTQEQMAWAKEAHARVVALLESAYETGDETQAREAVALHRDWLALFWAEEQLTAASHKAMGQMYCDDPRFRANYTKKYEALPEYFRDAIARYYDAQG